MSIKEYYLISSCQFLFFGSVSALENDMKRLHRDLQATKKEVIYYSSKHGPADKIFVQVVDEFLTPATSRLFKLQNKFDSMKKSVSLSVKNKIFQYEYGINDW